MDMNQIEEMIAKAAGSYASKASISTGTGIVAYDLEPLLKQVYPVLCPFRNSMPRRVSSKGGTSFNAKLLTSIASGAGGIGVLEGHRGVDISVVEQDVSVYYRTVGQDVSTTFEAEDAADNFDDARAIAQLALLNANLIAEEKLCLFGNGGNISRAGANQQVALGTPPAPVLTGVNVGGTVAAATYLAYVVALTYAGMQQASVLYGVATQTTRTNNDGSTQTTVGGSSNVSAASNTQVITGTGVLTATVTPVAGAMGYAWYIGTSKATAALAAVTQGNTAVISAPPAGVQVATAITADNSIDPTVYDGIVTQTQQANSGAYVVNLNGAPLTASAAAGINEIDVGLKYMYDTYRLGPDKFLVDSGTKRFIDSRIIGGGGAPLFRFTDDAVSGARGVDGNTTVKQYYNVYTGKMIPIEVHPYFPVGMLFGYATTLPYQTPNVPVPFRFQARSRDWTEYEWPLVTRTRGRGQYVSAAIISYTPWSNMLMTGIGQS